MNTTPATPPPAPKPAVAMIDATKLAALANLTKRRLYQLAEENKIPSAITGQFPMLETITALFVFYQNSDGEMKAEKLRQVKLENARLERENALENKTIHDENAVDQKVRHELLMPLRDGLHGLQKKYHRLKDSQPDIATKILENDLPELIEKLRVETVEKKRRRRAGRKCQTIPLVSLTAIHQSQPARTTS